MGTSTTTSEHPEYQDNQWYASQLAGDADGLPTEEEEEQEE